jgi:hypothetical protein
MKTCKIFAAASLAALAIAGVPVRAQINTSSTIVVKSSTKTHTPKGNWMNAEVIRADSNSLVVREAQNGMLVHTFTYATQLQPRMEKIAEAGGYQYGDKVKVLYLPGQTVALKVHGKPSKAL